MLPNDSLLATCMFELLKRFLRFLLSNVLFRKSNGYSLNESEASKARSELVAYRDSVNIQKKNALFFSIESVF